MMRWRNRGKVRGRDGRVEGVLICLGGVRDLEGGIGVRLYGQRHEERWWVVNDGGDDNDVQDGLRGA